MLFDSVRGVDARIAHSHLDLWMRALKLQHRRAVEDTDTLDQEADAGLFALALDELVEAAKLAKEVDGRIELAIRQFQGRVPEAGHIRDVLTHFREYQLGTGRFQARKGPTSPDTHFYSDGRTVVMYLGDYKLDVNAAWEAAKDLDREVRALLPFG